MPRRARVIASRMGSVLVALGVAAALVWASGLAAAQSETAPAPLIASAQVSADRATLTIGGLNFGDPAGSAPTLSLALTPLPVTAWSATSVSATLPASLEAGSYLVLLVRGDQQAAAFHVTVDAVDAAVWR